MKPPAGFRWVQLTDIARLESGHTPSRRIPSYWGGSIPWIGIRDATANHGRTIYSTNEGITEAGIANSSARVLPAGTVCLSRTASVGYVVSMGVPMATSQDFVNWVCGPEIRSRYLHYILMSEQDSVRRFALGSVHQTVYYPEAKAFHVCLPDINQQDAIVGVLGALDDKIAVNERIAGAAGALAALRFESAVRDSSVVALSSLINPILGGTPDRAIPAYWGGNVPWASAKDVASSSFGTLVDTEEKITAMATKVTKAKPVPAGSVILTARGTVGAVARVAQPTALNQSCYAFVPDVLPPAVLYLTIRWAARSMLAVAHGTVFSTVNMKTFDYVMVPRLGDRAIDELEDRAGALLDSVTASMRENKALASLRDALLPGLMSGAIRVRDAEKAVEGAT